MSSGFLSDANWLNERRIKAYPVIFLTIYAIAIALYLLACKGMVDPMNRPVGTDFMNVWSAGKMAQQKHGAEAYDWNKHHKVQAQALPWQKGKPVPYYGWHYPPMFLMVAALLGMLPYGWALFVWMAATIPAYLKALHSIIPRRETIYAALAFPATFINLGHGQNGFLTAGLLGGGVVLLESNPYLAGVLFGLLAYKPQFGVLVPIALLFGGYWRAIFSAALTVIITAALSFKLFGIETWKAFFASLKLTRTVVLEQGSTGWEKIMSIFSAMRMWVGSIEIAYVAQGLYAIAAAILIAWIWERKTDMRLKGAALALGCLLATPYVLDYDLTVLALSIAWMAAIGLESGFRPYEKSLLVACFLLPLFARSLGMIHIPLAPFLLPVALWFVLRRVKTPSHSYLHVN